MAFSAFRCPECGEDTSVKFLSPGEIAECQVCQAQVVRLLLRIESELDLASDSSSAP